MKRHDENLRDVFDKHMPPAAPGVLEDAADRVLRRLSEGRHHQATEEQPAVSRIRYRPRFAVAAAVLIGMVGGGLYAIFRVQWEPSPPSVPPIQIAAITQDKDAGAAQLQLRLKFAAASVRPHPQPGPGVTASFGQLKCLGADGLLWAPKDFRDRTSPRRGRCSSSGQGVFLRSVLLTAYASSPIVRLEFPRDAKFRPENVPSRAELQERGNGNRSPSFVAIEAVADDPERVTKGELKLMLQALLEDQFKARVHTETRELDGYVVTIAKSGIKFQETSGEPEDNGSGRPALDGRYTMEGVAQFLSNVLSPIPTAAPALPVLDKTGLAGIYAIDFALEEIQPVAVVADAPAGGPRNGGQGSPDPRQFTTPVPKAVEDRLGLHVERAKVPVQFIVIDNLEPLPDAGVEVYGPNSR